MQISRQTPYRTSTPRRSPQRRVACGLVEEAIVAEATANQTDGYRMVCAFVRRRLGIAVNRERVLRVMREHTLVQRRLPLERRKRPGYFRVERPRQLWQLDMTSIWVAEHGWTYLIAIIDCLTREIVAWQLKLRCRADEAIAVVDRAAAVHEIQPGELTLGSDNGSAFTAHRYRALAILVPGSTGALRLLSRLPSIEVDQPQPEVDTARTRDGRPLEPDVHVAGRERAARLYHLAAQPAHPRRRADR